MRRGCCGAVPGIISGELGKYMEKGTSSGRSKTARRIEWAALILVLVICIAAGFYLYRPREGRAVAVISVDGNEIRRIELEKAENGIFSIEEESGKPVSFELQDGAIRFVNVTCPDHICEKAGWCDAPGERAVCMPNRTALVCYDAQELGISG